MRRASTATAEVDCSAEPTAHAAIPGPREQVLPERENLFKALLAITLLLATFAAAGWVSAACERITAWPLAAVLALKWCTLGALAIVSGIFVTAMITLAHEAVHRVLFRSRFWNEAFGGLLSALSLVPLNANRQFHLTHHGYAHQPGHDPERAMHERPFWLAATVGSFIGIREQYKLYFASWRHVTHGKYTRRVLADTFFVALAAAFYFALVPALGIPVTVSVLPMLLVFPLVFSFRALSDHYGIPATVALEGQRQDILDSDASTWTTHAERRAREVSGWVVQTSPWLEWLWSHANYHEVHHKYPHLSHRYLPRVFELTRARVPYYLAGGYWRSILRICGLTYDSRPEQLSELLTGPEGERGLNASGSTADRAPQARPRSGSAARR